MKKLPDFWARAFGVLIIVALLASCRPIIGTEAASMNLTLSDLDATFELVVDENLAELQADFPEEMFADIYDASRRVFVGPDRVVWSYIISFSWWKQDYFGDIAISHYMNMALWLAEPSNDICRQLGKLECRLTVGQYTGMVPWYSIEGASFGQVAHFTRVGGETDTVQAFVLTFNQANVVAVLKVVGLLDTLEQSWVEELARMLESKIK